MRFVWFEKFLNKIWGDIDKLCYLCHALVSKPRPGCRMKRESGENPEQSRCCKLL